MERLKTGWQGGLILLLLYCTYNRFTVLCHISYLHYIVYTVSSSILLYISLYIEKYTTNNYKYTIQYNILYITCTNCTLYIICVHTYVYKDPMFIVPLLCPFSFIFIELAVC